MSETPNSGTPPEQPNSSEPPPQDELKLTLVNPTSDQIVGMAVDAQGNQWVVQTTPGIGTLDGRKKTIVGEKDPFSLEKYYSEYVADRFQQEEIAARIAEALGVPVHPVRLARIDVEPPPLPNAPWRASQPVLGDNDSLKKIADTTNPNRLTEVYKEGRRPADLAKIAVIQFILGKPGHLLLTADPDGTKRTLVEDITIRMNTSKDPLQTDEEVLKDVLQHWPFASAKELLKIQLEEIAHGQANEIFQAARDILTEDFLTNLLGNLNLLSVIDRHPKPDSPGLEYESTDYENRRATIIANTITTILARVQHVESILTFLAKVGQSHDDYLLDTVDRILPFDPLEVDEMLEITNTHRQLIDMYKKRRKFS